MISPRESSPCYDLAGSCIEELCDSSKHHPKRPRYRGFLPWNTQHYGYFMPCSSAASVKPSGKVMAHLQLFLSCVIPAERSLPTAAPSIHYSLSSTFAIPPFRTQSRQVDLQLLKIPLSLPVCAPCEHFWDSSDNSWKRERAPDRALMVAVTRAWAVTSSHKNWPITHPKKGLCESSLHPSPHLLFPPPQLTVIPWDFR